VINITHAPELDAWVLMNKYKMQLFQE